MMTKDDFYKYMYENTAQELAGYWEKKDIRLVQRNIDGGNKIFLSLHTGRENILFDLDHLYCRYLAGESREEILCHILGAWKADQELFASNPHLNMDSFEEVKDHIKLRIYSADTAKKLQGERLLEYREFFTILYYVDFGKENGYHIALPVLQSHFEKWGVGRQQILEAALENQLRDGIFLVPLDEAANEVWEMENHNFFYGEPEGEDVTEFPCFCLTVKELEFGASLIVNPEVLRRVRHILGRNFYILPSSVHETIIVPDYGNNSRELTDLVREINAIEVAEYERLLDEALYYISEKDMVCSAAAYTAMKEKLLIRRKNDMIRRAMAGNLP